MCPPGEPVDTWYTDGLGCAQGVITAPLLFDLEFNDALEALARVDVQGAGVIVGDRRITGQLFADDLLIPAAMPAGLQALIDAFAAYCYSTRRKMNVAKPKCDFIACRDTDDVENYWYLDIREWRNHS